jgi:hypothetical protein
MGHRQSSIQARRPRRHEALGRAATTLPPAPRARRSPSLSLHPTTRPPAGRRGRLRPDRAELLLRPPAGANDSRPPIHAAGAPRRRSLAWPFGLKPRLESPARPEFHTNHRPQEIIVKLFYPYIEGGGASCYRAVVAAYDPAAPGGRLHLVRHSDEAEIWADLTAIAVWADGVVTGKSSAWPEGDVPPAADGWRQIVAEPGAYARLLAEEAPPPLSATEPPAARPPKRKAGGAALDALAAAAGALPASSEAALAAPAALAALRGGVGLAMDAWADGVEAAAAAAAGAELARLHAELAARPTAAEAAQLEMRLRAEAAARGEAQQSLGAGQLEAAGLRGAAAAARRAVEEARVEAAGAQEELAAARAAAAAPHEVSAAQRALAELVSARTHFSETFEPVRAALVKWTGGEHRRPHLKNAMVASQAVNDWMRAMTP